MTEKEMRPPDGCAGGQSGDEFCARSGRQSGGDRRDNPRKAALAVVSVVAIFIAGRFVGIDSGSGLAAESEAAKAGASEGGKPEPAKAGAAEGAARPDAEAGQNPTANSAAAKPAEAALPLDGRDGRELALDQFRPRSMLQAPQRLIDHARFPVVDVHTHPRIRLHDAPAEIDKFVALMDEQNIAVCVSLDGGMGPQLEEHKAHLWTKAQSRFVIFANIDWRGDGRESDPASWDCQRPDFAHRTVLALAEAKKAGASGLKVFKSLGLEFRNPDNSLIPADDARWDPIWEACGKLGLPVLIHTGDPAAFFLPVDATNERWEELRRHPDWSYHRPGYPTHAELLAQFEHIVARHPGTTFIGAHAAGSAEDLARVAGWLDQYPNLYLDIAARIAELGRQPRAARKFLIRYADRVLFGTDGPRDPVRLRYHWRFLESDDEYFPYAENPFPPQGFWRIYGIDLPDDALEKIYYGNAARLIPGVKQRYEAYLEARKK